MRRAEFVTAIILALLSLYLMWKSGEGPSWDTEYVHWSNTSVNIDGSGPGKGFFPFYLALGMLLSCVWIIVNAIRRTSPPSQSDEPFMDGYAKKMLLLVGGGLIGFLILVDLISMYAAIFVFMLYYMLILGRHPLTLSVVTSLVVPFWLYLFFDIVMTKVQPKGLRVIEKTIYNPMGEFFRDQSLLVIALCFVVSGGALALVARRAARA
jgi:hypothetical protein